MPSTQQLAGGRWMADERGTVTSADSSLTRRCEAQRGGCKATAARGDTYVLTSQHTAACPASYANRRRSLHPPTRFITLPLHSIPLPSPQTAGPAVPLHIMRSTRWSGKGASGSSASKEMAPATARWVLKGGHNCRATAPRTQVPGATAHSSQWIAMPLAVTVKG